MRRFVFCKYNYKREHENGDAKPDPSPDILPNGEVHPHAPENEKTSSFCLEISLTENSPLSGNMRHSNWASSARTCTQELPRTVKRDNKQRNAHEDQKSKGENIKEPRIELKKIGHRGSSPFGDIRVTVSAGP